MKFTAYITGAPDSLPDYAFQLVNFNLSKRDAVRSYYQITAPFSLEIVEAFEARPNGDVYIEKDGVAYEYCNVEDSLFIKGANSGSFMINGYRQETNASPVAVVIPASAVISEGTDFAGRFNLTVVPFAVTCKPGDTTTYKTVAYTIYQIQTTVGNQMNQIITLEVAP